MIPTKMTVFTDFENRTQIGNSLQACIATVLNMKLERVPHFYDINLVSASYDLVAFERLRDWLDPMGMYPIEIQPTVSVADEWFKVVEGYHIRGGRSKRGDIHWCVAYKQDLLYDPHPDNTFIEPLINPEKAGFWKVLVFGKRI